MAPSEAGERLVERRALALAEIDAALDVVDAFRDRPAGILGLNVASAVARTVLPGIVARFLDAFPEIRLEIIVEDSFVDVFAAGADADVRYDERLEQNMVAVPIRLRIQRFAAAAAPAYLAASMPGPLRAFANFIKIHAPSAT